MTANETSNQIERFWHGYLSGTNRGSVLIHVEQQGDTLRCKAIVQDQTFGPGIISLEGKLIGTRAELRLVTFSGVFLSAPLDGQLVLNFAQDFGAAEGTWQTDVGTQGTCKPWKSRLSASLWYLRLFGNRLQILLRKYCAVAYLSFLLLVVILALSKTVELSYQILILLLTPAPYLFRKHLIELFQALKVRKLGPLELEQSPLSDDTRLLIARQVQDTVAFVLLDGFFVPRTKAILLWLAQNRRVDRAQFDLYAQSIGVPPENLEATWSALLVSGCAVLAEGRLTITELGNRYATYLAGRN